MCLHRHLALSRVNPILIIERSHRWGHRLVRLPRAPGECWNVFSSCRGYPFSWWGLEGVVKVEVKELLPLQEWVHEWPGWGVPWLKYYPKGTWPEYTRAQSSWFTRTIQPEIAITLGSQLVQVVHVHKIEQKLNTKHRTWNLNYTMMIEMTIEITEKHQPFHSLYTCAHARAHGLHEVRALGSLHKSKIVARTFRTTSRAVVCT